MPRAARSLVVLIALSIAFPAAASARSELVVSRKRDLILAGLGGATYIGSQLLKESVTPAYCRWCASNSLDDAARDFALWDNTTGANNLSNVSGYILAPAAAVGLTQLVAMRDGRGGDFANNTIVIVSAAIFASDLNQLVKFLAMRERPFQHALPEAQKLQTNHDANLSFYSGHTSLVFSLAVASGTVASMRGYRWRGLIWATGLTLAATTGYLRMAADKHYLTDVMVGAIVGSGIGFSVPYFLHRRCAGGGELMLVPTGGAGMALSYRW